MEKAKKIFAVILAVLFSGWISINLLNDPFQFYKQPKISTTENRNLVRKPFFDIGLLDPYPKAYEAYYNDHFAFRPQIIRLNTLSSFFLFHKSPSPTEVAVGKDGWFFLAQDEKLAFNGTHTLSQRQLLGVAAELRHRAIVLKSKGIKFYVAFAPTKQEIYPEYLPPDYVRTPSGTTTDKIEKTVRALGGVHLIDLKTPLLEAKQYGRLYNKTDNHWNKFGSFFAYQAIVNEVRKDFPQVPLLHKEDVSFHDTIRSPGNLAIMLDLSDYLQELDFLPTLKQVRAKTGPRYGYKPYHAWESTDDLEVVRVTGDSSLPKAVIIRDSFTNAMISYLSEGFNKTVYIFDSWHYAFNEPVIEHEKPDLVLLIIYEPHIHNLLNLQK